MTWTPSATTKPQWLLTKILQGFVSAPIESLCEISIADLSFMHERGTHIALYGFMLAGSNFLAPVFGGLIDAGMGWKWVLVSCFFFSFFLPIRGFITVVGFFEEEEGEEEE